MVSLEKKEPKRSAALIIIVGCIVAIPALLLFAALGVLAVNVPYWDDYGAIVRYMGWPFGDRMQHLFDFHNEHRIVTVRLFLDAMVALTGALAAVAVIALPLTLCTRAGVPAARLSTLLTTRVLFSIAVML